MRRMIQSLATDRPRKTTRDTMPLDTRPKEDVHHHDLPAASSDAIRPTGRQRPRGLVMDADVVAESDDVDIAVRPTNTQRPYHTPSESRRPRPAASGSHGLGLGGLPRASFASFSQRRITTVSSYIESQERFDNYVDAINDEEAERCSMHAVLSTDIVRLVAELDVLHNRIAMANMRAAYYRRSTSEVHTRRESWSVGTQPISHTCSCGRRFEMRPGQRARMQRQTRHAAVPVSKRSPSRHSESKEDVMLRYSAGTTLFRMSLHEGQKKRWKSLDQAEQPVPRVELSTPFNFRSECEMVARRMRPTFAALRS